MDDFQTVEPEADAALGAMISLAEGKPAIPQAAAATELNRSATSEPGHLLGRATDDD